jgi:hypothetical protein
MKLEDGRFVAIIICSMSNAVEQYIENMTLEK